MKKIVSKAPESDKGEVKQEKTIQIDIEALAAEFADSMTQEKRGLAIYKSYRDGYMAGYNAAMKNLF